MDDEIRIASEGEFEKRNRRRMCRGGCSSVGRAVALQAIGQEFESPQLHQTEISNLQEFEVSTAGYARLGRVAQLVRACA